MMFVSRVSFTIVKTSFPNGKWQSDTYTLYKSSVCGQSARNKSILYAVRATLIQIFCMLSQRPLYNNLGDATLGWSDF